MRYRGRPSRRAFLRLSGGLALAHSLPRLAWPQVDADPAPLPIPSILPGQLVDGRRVFDLTMERGTTSLLPGTQTATLGYNGNLLGPTLLMRRGEDVALRVTNQIGEDTTTHWHGIHLPAVMDGTPHQTIPPGETWTASYTVLNRAGTYWYHPHTHPERFDPRGQSGTSGQVYKGLAGLLIVTDETGDALPLPRSYGVDDVPLIIQDKAIQADGSLDFFPLDPVILRKGPYICVNGAISPTLETHAQLIRFRILNGSCARVYNLGFSDNRPFWQIASDGGFLPSPLPMDRLVLSPAERAEIVVDFSADAGRRINLVSYSSELGRAYVSPQLSDPLDSAVFDVMGFSVGGPTTNAVTGLPASLVAVERIAEHEAHNLLSPRPFVLGNGVQSVASINGKKMSMARIDETIRLNETEVWDISNTTPIAHPFHVHGDSFQVVSRDGAEPGPNEMGWKDVVLVRVGETVRIIKHFRDFADAEVPYMYHCHILDHEDSGMMGQFAVVAEA